MTYVSGDTWRTTSGNEISTALMVLVRGNEPYLSNYFTVGADPDDDEITFTTAWKDDFNDSLAADSTYLQTVVLLHVKQ